LKIHGTWYALLLLRFAAVSASYCTYFINFIPMIEQAAQFITTDLILVMQMDAHTSSHPIVQQVHHPDEISQLFDDISYKKVFYNIRFRRRP
jgi:hypothetical protein